MKKIKGLHMIKTVSFVLMMAVVLTFVSIQAMAATCPTPTGVKQTDATEAAFKIAWNASAGATEYGVSVSKDKTTWSDEQIAKTNEFVVAGMASATAYQVRVRAHNASGWSEYSKPYTVVTSPKAPKNVKMVETGADYVKIAWDKSENATGYNVYWAKGNAETVLITKKPLEKTEVIIKGIKANTQYTVEIQPVIKASTNFVAYGKAGANKKIVTLSKALKNVKVTAWNTQTGEISVKWTSASKYADGYEVSFWNKNGKLIKAYNVADRSNKKFTTTSPKLLNRPCYVRVRTYKKIGKSYFYGEYSVAQVIVPEASVSVEQLSVNSARISWKKYDGARGYAIYYSTQPNTGFKLLKKVSANAPRNYTFINLQPKAAYYVYVVPTSVVLDKKKYKPNPIAFHNVALVKNTAVVSQ